MSILDALPSPRPVLIGGRTYHCGQLRIGDFAAFQGYLEDHHPHPFEVYREELATLEGKERRRLLARLQTLDYDYPPRFPCAESDRIFQTVEGLAIWLLTVLSRHNAFTAKDALLLADAINEEELAALEKVAYDVSPSTQLYRLIHPDQPSSSLEADWAEIIDEVSVSHGWTYEYIGDLTLSQFSLALTGRGRMRRPINDVSHMNQRELHEMLKQQRADLGYKEEEGVDG